MKLNYKRGVLRQERRRDALRRLQVTLDKGVKTSKGDGLVLMPLTEKDIKRINKEIVTLKDRL
jgi:hypothetical protein